MEKEKKIRRIRLLGGILFLGLFLTAGCKGGAGEKKELTAAPTPTTAPEKSGSGFEAADQERVRKRAGELSETVAMKVGSREIRMDTAMVLIYFMEVRGNYYAAYYEENFGSDYWNTVYDESGKTARDVFKEETIEALIRYAVLYDCAIRNGVELTESEQRENTAYVERVKAALTAEETERGGFTTESLEAACAWMMTAEKYYDTMAKNLGITRESVAETMDPAEYREYETEYLYLPTTYYDENYQVCEESPEVIAERLARMEEYFACLQGGESMEEVLAKDPELTRKTRLFREEGTGAEQAYAEAARQLQKGELVGPVTTEYGIYLIRMLDDDCRVSYEEAVDAAFEVKKSEALEAAYRILAERYPVEREEAVWEDIVMGATVSLRE